MDFLCYLNFMQLRIHLFLLLGWSRIWGEEHFGNGYGIKKTIVSVNYQLAVYSYDQRFVFQWFEALCINVCLCTSPSILADWHLPPSGKSINMDKAQPVRAGTLLWTRKLIMSKNFQKIKAYVFLSRGYTDDILID